MIKVLTAICLVASCLSGAEVVTRECPDSSVKAYAGTMTTKYESIVCRLPLDLYAGDAVSVSATSQVINHFWGKKMCVGWYLVIVEPDGTVTRLTRPRGENILGQDMHYKQAFGTGYYKAPADGHYEAQLRVYCGTYDLKKSSALSCVYNEIQALIHE